MDKASLCLAATMVLGAMTGCAGGDDEEELLLRIELSGSSIATVEVVERGLAGELDDELRPQPTGETGLIWTEYSSGETLCGGWLDRPVVMASGAPSREIYAVVPAPESGAGLLTLTLSTADGPLVLTWFVATTQPFSAL